MDGVSNSLSGISSAGFDSISCWMWALSSSIGIGSRARDCSIWGESVCSCLSVWESPIPGAKSAMLFLFWSVPFFLVSCSLFCQVYSNDSPK